MKTNRRAILFYNEKSGRSTADHPRLEIEQYLRDQQIDFTTLSVLQPRQKLRAAVKEASNKGLDFALAAGGDGTVSIAGDLLMDAQTPLIILPQGTGNLIAKELKIPLKLEEALALVKSDQNRTFTLDTFSSDGMIYIMNLSVGVSSQIMQATPSDEKKRLGFFAYFKNFIKQVFGLQLKRFEIEVDGQSESFPATEVMITNSRLIAINPLEWGEDVFIDDGVLDLFIVRAANITDILGFILSVFTKRTWQNPIVHHFKVRDYCKISSPPELPVQADGDMISKTPVEVTIHPRSLKILVPSTKLKNN